MQRFPQLYAELDRTTRTNDKLAAMVRYFREAPHADAAWALYFLSGQKIKRAVTSTQLRTLIASETGLPVWLIEESYAHVGDAAETMAWLLPENDVPSTLTLAELVETRALRLKSLDDSARRSLLRDTWHELSSAERFVWNKLITGEFRVGVSATLVTRALAEVAGIPQAVMAHRLAGSWQPTSEFFANLLSGDNVGQDLTQPYPFFLAYALEDDPTMLGNIEDWQLEWKWDGIRAQLVRRNGQLHIWSRGDELVTDRFPELHSIAALLPDGTVLDGEILAWRDDAPLPFAALQRRIGRLRVDYKSRTTAPVMFMAYDVLERDGRDVRELPFAERRQTLVDLIGTPTDRTSLRISPLVAAESWSQLDHLRAEARIRGVEGIMLKRRDAPYGVGRVRGPWWKWKVQPHTIDAVLIVAQAGHGRRAGLFTDYTFGLWHDGQLVPVAKAYSGLTDAEIRQVDAFIRAHTIEKRGPVRIVEPQLVFELHFEAIQASTRHKSGIAVRFPRIHRWRQDKPPTEADTLQTLRAMLRAAEPAPPEPQQLLFEL